MSGLTYDQFVDIRSAIRTTGLGASLMMPVGGICMFPSILPPIGYLLCNGQPVTIVDYPNLYAVIGHTFDGSPIAGSFCVPDMGGRFVVGTGQNGTDTAYNVNDKGGAQTVALATGEVGAHSHGLSISDPGHSHGVTLTDPGHGHGTTESDHSHGTTEADHSHGVSDPGHAHGGAANTRGGLYVDGAPDAGRGGSTDTAYTGLGISGAKTGLTVNGAKTGVSVNSAVTGFSVSVATASTGLGATVATTAAATGHENRPPYIAMAYIIRAI